MVTSPYLVLPWGRGKGFHLLTRARDKVVSAHCSNIEVVGLSYNKEKSLYLFSLSVYEKWQSSNQEGYR